ncbi:MAG: hypothetical protein AB8H86_06615 [Polyangiales bacterium]
MSITLSGYGPSAEDARSQAHLVALESAELIDGGTIWAQFLGASFTEGAVTLPRLSEIFAVSPAANASPGWDFRPGACQPMDSAGPEANSEARVNVRWGAGTQAQASSDSMAMAIEQARRRSCHAAWAETFYASFNNTASAPPSVRSEVFQAGVSELNAAFGACIASDDYVVEASQHPRLAATGAEFCAVSTAADERTLFDGKAQGSSRAHALERASLQAIRGTLQATHSALAEALADEAPDLRMMLLARTLSNGIRAIGAQSIVGNARSRCAPVEQDLVAEWHPESACGDGFVGAPWSANVCAQVAEVGRGHVRDAVAAMGEDADPNEAALVLANGFGVVSGCAHDCGSEVQVTGLGAFVRTRGAHCRSETDARAIVERGIAERKLSGLLHCASPALFGAFVSRYQEDAERFWDAVSGIRERLTFTEEDGRYWAQMP